MAYWKAICDVRLTEWEECSFWCVCVCATVCNSNWKKKHTEKNVIIIISNVPHLVQNAWYESKKKKQAMFNDASEMELSPFGKWNISLCTIYPHLKMFSSQAKSCRHVQFHTHTHTHKSIPGIPGICKGAIFSIHFFLRFRVCALVAVALFDFHRFRRFLLYYYETYEFYDERTIHTHNGLNGRLCMRYKTTQLDAGPS